MSSGLDFKFKGTYNPSINLIKTFSNSGTWSNYFIQSQNFKGRCSTQRHSTNFISAIILYWEDDGARPLADSACMKYWIEIRDDLRDLWICAQSRLSLLPVRGLFASVEGNHIKPLASFLVSFFLIFHRGRVILKSSRLLKWHFEDIDVKDTLINPAGKRIWRPKARLMYYLDCVSTVSMPG